ncbi:MAG: hypothetical protein ACO1NY_15235 [Pseudorhodoplanes sp.]
MTGEVDSLEIPVLADNAAYMLSIDPFVPAQWRPRDRNASFPFARE